MASKKRQTGRSKRASRPRYEDSRGKHQLFFGVLSFLIAAVCIVAGSIIFFKVDEITVEGNVRYTSQQIIDSVGLKEGDNLFLMNKFRVQDDLVEALPYIKEVVIRRSLPGTVHLIVTECEPTAAVECASGYWLIDDEGQLLELSADTQGAIPVTGIAITTPRAGTDLAVEEDYEIRRTSLLNLLQALNDHELLGNVLGIDLSSNTRVVMQYTDRFSVKIPYGANYDYKVYMLDGVVNNLSQVETGVIDMSKDDEAHFIPYSS